MKAPPIDKWAAGMKVLIDTSVLVSAMLPDHIHHTQSRPWIERAEG